MAHDHQRPSTDHPTQTTTTKDGRTKTNCKRIAVYSLLPYPIHTIKQLHVRNRTRVDERLWAMKLWFVTCLRASLPLVLIAIIAPLREVKGFSHHGTQINFSKHGFQVGSSSGGIESRHRRACQYEHNMRLRERTQRKRYQKITATAITATLDHDEQTYDYEYYDWKNYQYQHQSPYVKKFNNHGIIYKKGAISRDEFNDLQSELSSLSLNLIKETTSSVAINRIGSQIPYPSKIHDIFSNPDGTFMKLIHDIHADDDLILSQTVPVEMRVYETRGAGMEWHFDDILYSPEQTEVVFTVENNSDCVTLWEERKSNGSSSTSNDDDIVELKQVETEANSAIILKAGPKGARHRVSPLKSGKRVILKLVYVRKDAIFLDGAEKHLKQFTSKKKRKKRHSKVAAAMGV